MIGATLTRACASAVLLCALAGMAATAQAQSGRNRIAAGGQVARDFCSRCHIVEPGGGSGWTDAPSFEAIAGNPGTTLQRLRNFISRPHMHMLAYNEAHAHADELARYIMSLRHK